jgi:cyclopropane fatty-acyl-phospholipid synthase-like methyltransferase
MSLKVKDNYTPPNDLKARLAASYDRLAPTYNTWTSSLPSPRLKWLQEMLKHLTIADETQSTNILELGAGAGLPTTKAILDYSPTCHVLANDLSPVQLSLLQSNLSDYKDRITSLPGDMLTLDPAPGSLAAVVGMYSIIHLPQAEQAEMMRKISTWLKPGGLMLANFATENKSEMVMEEWLGVKDAWVYWSGLGVDGTIEAIATATLEIVEHEVISGDGVDADFLWILARKPL